MSFLVIRCIHADSVGQVNLRWSVNAIALRKPPP